MTSSELFLPLVSFRVKFLTIKNTGFTEEDVNLILKAIEYKRVPLDDVEFEISIVKMPKGTGRVAPYVQNFKKKTSVVSIANLDNLCMYHAIVTGLANLEYKRKTGKWTELQVKFVK